MKIIIANTNTQLLLKSVNKTLEKYPTNKNGDIPVKLKGQATLSALKKVFQEKYFSVCEFDSMANMNNVHMPREVRDYLQTLHCVDFADMTQETREFLFAKCVDLFKDNIAISNFKLDVPD